MALVRAVNIFTSLNSLGQVVGRQMAGILTVSHGYSWEGVTYSGSGSLNVSLLAMQPSTVSFLTPS